MMGLASLVMHRQSLGDQEVIENVRAMLGESKGPASIRECGHN